MKDVKLLELDEDFVSSATVKDDSVYMNSLNKIESGSILSVGEHYRTTLPVYQHFNWLQKLMWKWCFGVKVEDYNKEK